MIKNKSSVVVWLTLGGLMAVLGSVQCGNTTTTSGTETHWLAMCEVDADCGRLRCLCGVCTEDCTDDDGCQALADTAVCAAASATDLATECAADPRLCVRAGDVVLGSGGSATAASSTGGSSAGGGGGASATGANGSSTGATGATTGGSGSSTGAAGAAGAATAAACEAQDARGVGSGTCERDLGTRWTGEACEFLFACECEGADCGELSETLKECAQEHTVCFDDQVCSDEMRDIVELVNANKSCADTSDCVTHFVGCGVSEDDCTGAVYSNPELDSDELRGLTQRYATCFNAFEPELVGCGTCDRIALPPSCVEGRCIGADPCTLERNLMATFMFTNDVCETADDCATEVVGCGVSEDDCTGAVYLSEGFDRAEFDRLKGGLYACAAGAESCALCEREIAPAACVSGRCQRE